VRKQSEPQPESGDIIVDLDIDAEHEWRMRMLTGIGFTPFQAFRLSINGADWHECQRLLDGGCDHQHVLHILI